MLALIAASSCQSQPAKPTGAKVIDQLLTRCHNMLRGTMADCYLELREAGGREWTKVVLGSGKLMLAMRPDGSGEVLIGAPAYQKALSRQRSQDGARGGRRPRGFAA